MDEISVRTNDLIVDFTEVPACRILGWESTIHHAKNNERLFRTNESGCERVVKAIIFPLIRTTWG